MKKLINSHLATHLVEEGAEDEDTYTLVWNPGRDSAEEETI